VDPVFGALTHHGPLDDNIAVVNGECDTGLVQDHAVFSLEENDGVSGFVDDDTLATSQG
tara:strand:- start:712 stop:888 length:177 start_codon:yes stop_codon:yes gene_type:complete